MKRFSNKREALEREYRKANQKKLEDWDRLCEGCGLCLPCTPSHLIPRSFDITLLADSENFHYHCDKCANKCELGEYPTMKDGRVIYEYIERTRPDYLAMKELSYEERYKVTYENADWVY